MQGLLALRLQGPARQHKGLRRHLAHFTRDLLAVLVGLRAAVMLDYMVIPSELTLGIIQRLNTTCAGQLLRPCLGKGCAACPPATMALQWLHLLGPWHTISRMLLACTVLPRMMPSTMLQAATSARLSWMAASMSTAHRCWRKELPPSQVALSLAAALTRPCSSC